MFRLMAITPFYSGVARLRGEALEEGFWFVDRLINDWTAGLNRFDLPGERFLGAFTEEDLQGFSA